MGIVKIEENEPIPVSTSFPKMLRKILCKHILWHTKNVISDRQPGSLPERSNTSNLFGFTQDQSYWLECEKQVDVIINFLRTFDRVDHDLRSERDPGSIAHFAGSEFRIVYIDTFAVRSNVPKFTKQLKSIETSKTFKLI